MRNTIFLDNIVKEVFFNLYLTTSKQIRKEYKLITKVQHMYIAIYKDLWAIFIFKDQHIALIQCIK